MKHHKHKQIATALLALGAVSVGYAQPVNRPVNVPPAVRAPAVQPRTLPAPSLNAGARAGAGVNASRPAPVRANSAAQVRGNATVSPRKVDVDANVRASERGRAKGAAFNGALAGNAAVTLSAAGTLATIEQSTVANRDAVAADVQAQLETSRGAMKTLKARADEAGGQTRAEFAKAAQEVRAAEKELRASLKELVKANGDNWGQVQSAVARDFTTYAEAMAEAEAAAGTPETPPPAAPAPTTPPTTPPAEPPPAPKG
jgi:hypothetical protein